MILEGCLTVVVGVVGLLVVREAKTLAGGVMNFIWQLTKREMKKEVEKIFETAVMIVEKEFEKSTLPRAEKNQKKLEQATNIIADVLNQNGINPRDYNIPGLINYTLEKLKTKN